MKVKGPARTPIPVPIDLYHEPVNARLAMRGFATLAIVLLAGCSATPAPTQHAETGQGSTPVFDERNLLDTPFEARTGQGGNASFVLPTGGHGLKLRVVIQDLVGTRLAFRGPGECADFTPIEGMLSVHAHTGYAMEAECGAVAAGPHDLQWEAEGFAQGHVYVRAYVPVPG
jgi:hypothetical protein